VNPNKPGKECWEFICLRFFIDVQKVGMFSKQIVKDKKLVVKPDKKSGADVLSGVKNNEPTSDNTVMIPPNKIPSVLRINKSMLGVFRFFEAIIFR
jgi:hypothetical protein